MLQVPSSRHKHRVDMLTVSPCVRQHTETNNISVMVLGQRIINGDLDRMATAARHPQAFRVSATIKTTHKPPRSRFVVKQIYFKTDALLSINLECI